LTPLDFYINWRGAAGRRWARQKLEDAMLSNRLGVLAVLTISALPALAQVQSGSPGAVSPDQHKPMKFHRVRSDGTVESENWSGYAVTGSGFTKAQGSWNVSTVDCSATPNTYAAFWAGIDGYSSDTVDQTGTIGYCSGSTARY
jgi:hypothetical protein